MDTSGIELTINVEVKKKPTSFNKNNCTFGKLTHCVCFNVTEGGSVSCDYEFANCGLPEGANGYGDVVDWNWQMASMVDAVDHTTGYGNLSQISAYHSSTQHSTQHSTAHHSTTPHSTQHSTPQRTTAQHSTTHSTAHAM